MSLLVPLSALASIRLIFGPVGCSVVIGQNLLFVIVVVFVIALLAWASRLLLVSGMLGLLPLRLAPFPSSEEVQCPECKSEDQDGDADAGAEQLGGSVFGFVAGKVIAGSSSERHALSVHNQQWTHLSESS